MKGSIKGVIFDFNGTLFFDSDKHEEAWKKFSSEIRGYPLSDEEILTKVHGRTNKTILEYLLHQPISDQLLKQHIQNKEQYYQQSCLQDPANLKLADGATALFEFLLDRNIGMTIATAAEITNLTFFNEQFCLDRWFDLDKIVYDDGKINGKPEPDMFLKAAEKINRIPSDCLVFEDSESGIAAAAKAGIAKLVIVDPADQESKYRTHPEVDLVIPDFTKIDTSIFY